MSENFQITNITKDIPPISGSLFMKIKNFALGEKYNLSLVFADKAKMKLLNNIYKNKNRPTDILSFPLSKKEGEIFICLSETKKESKKFERDFENFTLFLFIHGLCHLKGMTHGSKMEQEEKKIRLKFKV